MSDVVPVTFVSSHAQRGGSERYLYLLLQEAGSEWIGSVVTLEEGPFVHELEGLLGRPPRVIATGRRVGIVKSAWLLRRQLSRRGASVVHANGVKAALVSVLATIFSKVRVIWVKHDFSWDGPLGRAIARRCHLVVGVSAAVLEDLRLDPRRTRVIHTGLPPVAHDVDASRIYVRDLLGVGGSQQIVLLVGRLHPAKGQIELVEAMPEIARRCPDVRSVLLGGEDRTTLDYAARVKRRVDELALRGSVMFLEHRPDADRFIAGADLVVIPSVRDERGMGREGFSLVAIEAMMAGTPVAAYSDGALPEVLGTCAQFAPPGDRNALAAAIAELLTDAERRETLRGCGRERAAEGFRLDEMVEAMKDCYRTAARVGGGVEM